MKRETLQNLNVLPCLLQSDHVEGESIAGMFKSISIEKLTTIGQWLEENLAAIQKKQFL